MNHRRLITVNSRQVSADSLWVLISATVPHHIMKTSQTHLTNHHYL